MAIREMPEFLVRAVAVTQRTLRAEVVGVDGDGTIWATSDERADVPCDLLSTSESAPLQVGRGDEVLVWMPADDYERGVVLGRIGAPAAPAVVEADPPASAGAAVEQLAETPDEIVFEAKKNITFKCGEGSITLRKDGKILIKGKDLVSRASRVNRIKGGSVSIN